MLADKSIIHNVLKLSEKQGVLCKLLGEESDKNPYFYDASLLNVNDVLASLFCLHRKNVLISGDSGSGKTSFVSFLAENYSRFLGNENEAAPPLFFLAINISGMIAGTRYRGELEEKFIHFLEALALYSNIVVFFDEAHTLFYTKSEWGIGLMDMIKPYVSSSHSLKMILATTSEEMFVLEQDRAFSRRFRHFHLPPLSSDMKKKAVEKHIKTLQSHHGLTGSFELQWDKSIHELIDEIDLSLAKQSILLKREHHAKS